MASANLIPILHIPEKIRFQCSRCAHCCNAWPVPLNEGDVRRLSQIEPSLTFSLLSAAEQRSGLRAFTHSLDKRPDGRCQFLTDSVCSVHEIGKPAMCRLFPYSFMDCPDGVYLGLSFASTGVLQNSGALLADQQENLQETLTLFRSLFAELEQSTRQSWLQISLLEGLHLPYAYCAGLLSDLAGKLSANIDEFTQTQARESSLDILCSFFNKVVGECPSSFFRNRLALSSQASVQSVDSYLLKAMAESYFGGGALRPVDDQNIAQSVAEKLAGANPESLQKLSLPPLSAQAENLLARFVYVRVFSRMFFGPGFSSLSFLAGLSHLILLIVMLRRQLPDDHYLQSPEVQLRQLEEKLRQLDGKWTSARYGSNTRAMLEIMFLDKERVNRLRDSL